MTKKITLFIVLFGLLIVFLGLNKIVYAQFTNPESVTTRPEETIVRWNSGEVSVVAGRKVAVAILESNNSIRHIRSYQVPQGKVLKVRAMFLGVLEDE